MNHARQVRYGSLDCLVVDGGDAPRIAVVLCHGYGAPGDDLAGLSPAWIDLLGERAGSFRFVFPAAPHTLAELGMPGARAWWPINMAQLAAAVQASRFDQLHDQQPPGINQARDTLSETVQQVKQDLNGASTPLVLGGFSQGAMLTMDLSLRGELDPPARLFQFSGTMICRPQWLAAITRLAQTPVFQSHGRLDPILPYTSAVALSEMLRSAGVTVDFHSFDGPHTIDVESIARSAHAMNELATTSAR